MRSITPLILCSVLLFLCGCSQRLLRDPSDTVSRLSGGGSLQLEVDLLARPLIASDENVGVVVSVFDGHSPTQTFAYGYQDRHSRKPMTPDTVFAIGSVTKPIVVSLLLAMEEKGIVSLKDPIGPFLPGNIAFQDPRIRDISFGQLASHSSGLPREPLEIDSILALGRYVVSGENVYGHLTEEHVFNYLKDYHLPDPPSEHPRYSNIGLGLLAHLLTVRTGKNLDTLLQEYLFAPLGMRHSYIEIPPDSSIERATGHAGDQPFFIARNTPLPDWNFPSMMRGAGAAYSNGPDLIRLLKAHLGRSGTPLDQAFRRSLSPVARDGRHAFFTVGWIEEPHPEYGVQLYYYHGMVSGYNCYVGFEPVSGVAVAVLRNNFNWQDKVGHELLLSLAVLAKQSGSHAQAVSLSPANAPTIPAP